MIIKTMSKNKFVPTERGQTNLSGDKILDKSDSHVLAKKRPQLLLLLKKISDLFVIGLIINLSCLNLVEVCQVEQ